VKAELHILWFEYYASEVAFAQAFQIERAPAFEIHTLVLEMSSSV